MFETMARDVEQFMEEVSQGMQEAADALVELSESMVEQMEEAFAPQMDRLEQEMEGWLDPFLELVSTLETSLMDTAAPVTHTVEPMMNQHPACVGCRHYHGQAYNGVMFVCGMHPYGWEAETCPDWESIWGKDETPSI